MEPTLRGITALDEPEGAKKMFSCPEEGCGKSFARREHLHRHEFNHKDSDFTCLRCAAHFRRRDLLERHKLRHQQKDVEAGGEGLGYLATRKRLWKDNDGKVVNSSRKHKNSSSKSRPTGAMESRPSISESTAPPSPPTSQPGSSTEQTSIEHEKDISYIRDPWQLMDLSIAQNVESDLDFLSTSSWTDQSFNGLMKAPCDLPYNELSFPDTTISFNTSLPTSHYYSWLFGKEFGYHDPERQFNVAMSEASNATSLSSCQDSTNGSPYNSGLATLGPSPLTPRRGVHDLPDPVATSDARHLRSRMQNKSLPSPDLEADGKLHHGSLAREPPFRDKGANAQSASNSVVGASLGIIEFDNASHYFTPSTQQDCNGQGHDSSSDSSFTLLPDSYMHSSTTKLPIVTDEARDRIMQLISQSRPTRPDDSEITPCDPLLSLASLQHYSDLFFTCFNMTYPLIHPSTFQSSTAHPLLLMAIILLGATHSDKTAHLLAVCIHDKMRPLIHSHKEFGPRPKLWMLQTILLVECFGKSRAGERQHDMSNIYHGLQINLLRRSDCLTAHVPPWDGKAQTLEDYWHSAIESEEKRRLALISFMWDTQHAIFFAQILCMNASELKVTLPWDPAIWAADTAEEWLYLTQASPAAPQYLNILQTYTDPGATPAPLHLNALSRLLVFHGLMSLSWDFRRRDQTALNRGSISSESRWQYKVSVCYKKWDEDFDRYAKEVLTSLSPYPTHCAKFQRFAVASTAIYHTAQLVLEVETADLQIQAGAKHIMGRPLTDIDRQRSQARLNELCRRREGKDFGRAVWHAARLLRDGIRKLDNWGVDDMVHFPWCLYLATLACWTFYSISVERCADEINAPAFTGPDFEEDEDSDWDSRTDMKALVSALTRLDPTDDTFSADVWSVARRYKPHGLIKCLKKYLGTVRWAVIREGVAVLQGLIYTERVSS